MKPVTILETTDKKYWIKAYEFEGMEAKAKAVALMPNGDIVVAGSIKPKKENAKSSGLVARLDKEGNVKWVRILGGNEDDEFNDVKVAPNGDIIVAGKTESFGQGREYYPSFWVLMLDENGNVKWQKTYGGYKSENAKAVAIAPNGDIIIAGWTSSFGAGYWDVWVLWLDANGNVKWQKTYGGKSSDYAHAVAIAPNGDIIIAGSTHSFGAGKDDFWVIRLDENGNVKWQKSYGGSDDDGAYSLALAPNGDIIVAGETESFGAGSRDVWVLRLDSEGNVKWQKSYGGPHWDDAKTVVVAENKEVIVAGHNGSFNKAWILRLDVNGNIKWQKICKESYSFNSLALTPEGDIIAVGHSFIVAKIPPNGNFPNCNLWEDTNAIVMDTQAVVKNTKCKVKKAGGLLSRFKITNTNATIRTAIPKVEVLCEWSLEKPAKEIEKPRRRKPCPGYLINNRCYIVKAMVMDEAGLKSALEELDKELSSIDFIQPLPDEITVHPFKGIIEGENLFVTRNIVSRGPGESGIIPSEWLIEILDWIKKAVIPEIEVPERVAEAFAQSLPEAEAGAKEPEVKAKLAKAIKSKPAKETKTVEGFPSPLLQRYEPLEFLGEGGFAKVFKARRKEDGKVVALKIPRIDEKTSSLFIKEVAAWYNLNHENIVRLYRADILPIPYLEMEFVEGVEVDGKLVRALENYPKPVDEETALKLIKGIARGLAHAHSKGIYHLDLKPLNVLLKADLTPKITDWGLAKISARSSLSRHSGYSPLYAAPEQLDEETYGEPDGRTDVYQLGLIFYELLTGELPYKATSPGALVGKILSAKPKPISELKPELKRFDGVFEKLLAKRKEERYGSVEEFLSALESLTELEREKEELRKTSMAMRRSRSREEFERLKIESVRKTVKIAVLAAKLNDKAELLAALDELKFYTRENLDDLLSAIAQVELLLKEGIPIGPEVEKKVRALVLRIEGEALSK